MDIGVVWGVSRGGGDRVTSHFRIALLDFGPLSHPHDRVFSNLWFAVPGHDGVLASVKDPIVASQNLTFS